LKALKLSSLTLSYWEDGPKWWIESGDWEGGGEREEGEVKQAVNISLHP